MYFPSNLVQAFFRSVAVIGRIFAGSGRGTLMMLSSVSSAVPCADAGCSPGPLPCNDFDGAERDVGKSPGAGGWYSGSGGSGVGAGSAGGSGGGPSWASAGAGISKEVDIRTRVIKPAAKRRGDLEM